MPHKRNHNITTHIIIITIKKIWMFVYVKYKNTYTARTEMRQTRAKVFGMIACHHFRSLAGRISHADMQRPKPTHCAALCLFLFFINIYEVRDWNVYRYFVVWYVLVRCCMATECNIAANQSMVRIHTYQYLTTMWRLCCLCARELSRLVSLIVDTGWRSKYALGYIIAKDQDKARCLWPWGGDGVCDTEATLFGEWGEGGHTQFKQRNVSARHKFHSDDGWTVRTICLWFVPSIEYGWPGLKCAFYMDSRLFFAHFFCNANIAQRNIADQRPCKYEICEEIYSLMLNAQKIYFMLNMYSTYCFPYHLKHFPFL